MEKQENLRIFLQNLPEIKNKPSFVGNPLYGTGEYSLLPVRCFTCGKELSSDQELIINCILHGYKIQYILDALGYKRICCRRTIFTSALISNIIDYYEDLYNQYVSMASNQ